MSQDRSVSVGGSVVGSVIQTGNRNTGSVKFQQASLPLPETVDIAAELVALQSALQVLETQDKRKIDNAMEDAQEELKKNEPDKNEVGQAIERALNYAQKASGFAEAVDKLRPHVEQAVGWLGKNWHKILATVGLAI